MCIVIVERKQHTNIMVETGIDLDAEYIPRKDNESEHEFMLKNIGKINCILVDLPAILRVRKFLA
jgi:hypothetical protein